MSWLNNGAVWVHPIVYVGPRGVYTKYTLIVDRITWGPWYERYTFAVHDGMAFDPIIACGTAPWLWLAQWRAGWAVPS